MSDKPTKQEPKRLPKPSEILAQIVPDQSVLRIEAKYAQRFGRQATAVEESYEHLRGLRDHYRHKAGWSKFLAGVMALMIGFQMYLLGMVGAGHWDFTQYEWLLPALLIQNLAQVIGLAVIVVRSLFRDLRVWDEANTRRTPLREDARGADSPA